jgi:hypothetical protein
MSWRTKTLIGLLIYGIMLTVNAAADLYNRAPVVLPGTIPEMRDPYYWIERMEKPDEIIMPYDEIRRMNEEYQRKIRKPDPFKNEPEGRIASLSYWWPGMALYVPDLRSMPPEAVSDTVKTRIEIQINHLRKQDYGNALAVKYSDSDIDAFEHEMALDRVKGRITVRDGIAVRTTVMRNVPTFTPDQVGRMENGKTRWDLWAVCILKIGKPVLALHPSRSGEHVLVLSEYGFGWARSEDIAFAEKSIIDEFVNPKNFVVCTGDRVPFYSDESCTYASGFFRMGDRLPLVEKSDRRRIKVPVRKTSGGFTTEIAWLSPGADIYIGWLPYNRRNVVVTALKLLDSTYDWTGAWFGRQHETIYRDIFCCFGFELPYHGALFTFFGKRDEPALKPDGGKAEQYRVILEHEPFITLQSCGGHAQLLLGDYNGTPIVFDQHGYGYEDENGTNVEVRRCTVGDIRLPSYFLTRPVTFLELK